MGEVLTLEQPPPVTSTVLRSAVVPRRRLAEPRLPKRIVVLPTMSQDLDRVARYAQLCGFPLRDHVPATWLHVLSFGLQVSLLTARDFPFPVLGLVHTANTMTLHRPVHHREVLRLQVGADGLAAHRRGATFDVTAEARVGDELVWTGRSTYLARTRHTAALPAAAGTPEWAASPPDRVGQRWQLPADLGRRYAAVSGDANPIHLHPWAARAFGFSRTIVHGMWTHARCLAALEGRAGESHTVEVEFRKPILLPSVVDFCHRTGPGTGDLFAVRGGRGQADTVHLVGRLRGPEQA